MLVADDNPLLLEQAQTALERAGAQVTACDDGEDLGAVLRDRQPDLIVATTGALTAALRRHSRYSGSGRWRLPQQARTLLALAAAGGGGPCQLLVLIDPTDPEAPEATDIWELPPGCEVQQRPRDGARLLQLARTILRREGRPGAEPDTGAAAIPELVEAGELLEGLDHTGPATALPGGREADEAEDAEIEEIDLDDLELSGDVRLPDEAVGEPAPAALHGEVTAPRALGHELRAAQEDPLGEPALEGPAAELTGETPFVPLREADATLEGPPPAPRRGFAQIQRQAALMQAAAAQPEITAENDLPPRRPASAAARPQRPGTAAPTLEMATLPADPGGPATISLETEALPRAAETSSLETVALPRIGPAGDAAQEQETVALPRLSRTVGTATQPPAPGEAAHEVVLAGDLGAVPLLDVLRLLSLQRQSGVLLVQGAAGGADAELHMSVVFLRGQVAQATASGMPELRLGRFLQQALGSDEIDRVAALPVASHEPPLPLGVRLSRVGALSSEDLHDALSRQSAEVVYALLRLQKGRFLFTQPAQLPKNATDPALGGALGLDLDALLLEGYRRAAEWHLLEREGESEVIYQRVEERRGHTERLGLSVLETQVLTLCTGRHAVGEIARSARVPVLEAARILRRLQAVQLIRRRVAAMAG